jgi:hypothetical protein
MLSESAEQWLLSLIGGILFFIIASPKVFQLTGSLFSKAGLEIVDASGLPNVKGLLIHAVVFILLFRLVLFGKSKQDEY